MGGNSAARGRTTASCPFRRRRQSFGTGRIAWPRSGRRRAARQTKSHFTLRLTRHLHRTTAAPCRMASFGLKHDPQHGIGSSSASSPSEKFGSMARAGSASAMQARSRSFAVTLVADGLARGTYERRDRQGDLCFSESSAATENAITIPAELRVQPSSGPK